MNLYCVKCNCNHSFSPAEIERIIYELQHTVADHIIYPDNDDSSMKDKENEEVIICLLDELNASNRADLYKPYVDDFVGHRQYWENK